MQEPWGPWRDNMHAALIAREVRRPYMKDQAKNPIADFILRSHQERQEESAQKTQSFFGFFKSIATKVSASSLGKKYKRSKVNQP